LANITKQTQNAHKRLCTMELASIYQTTAKNTCEEKMVCSRQKTFHYSWADSGRPLNKEILTYQWYNTYVILELSMDVWFSVES
jgi:hypothetical protein